MSNPQEAVSRGTNKDEQSVDIKALVYTFLSNWYWFFISVVIALGLGWLYNHYKTPQYQVAGTVLIKDQKSRLDPTSIMTGQYFGNYQNLDNELAVLKSYSLCDPSWALFLLTASLSRSRASVPKARSTRTFLRSASQLSLHSRSCQEEIIVNVLEDR